MRLHMFPATAVAIALTLTAASARADEFSQFVKAFSSPSLSSESTQVKDLKLEVGHLDVEFSGSVSKIKVGRSDIGLFLSGRGRIVYESVDVAERAIMTFNTRKATGLKVEKSGDSLAIRDTFERMTFLTSRPELLPKISGEIANSPAEQFQSHREYFDRAAIDVVAHQFAKQHFDSPKGLVVRAEIGGGKENFIYSYDGVGNRTESLQSMSKEPGIPIRELQRRLWPVTLSEQLIGHDRRDFLEPLFLLTAIDYTLVASEKNDAVLTIEETILPLQKSQRVFKFSLYNRTFDSRGTGRNYTVKKVTAADGSEIPFNHFEDELVLALNAPAKPGVPLKIKYEIAGDFLIRPNGDSFWQLGVEPWFPQPDLGGQFYTVHSVVKVKKPFVPFAPGETIRREVEGEYNVIENRIDKPVQFAVVHAGKYDYQEEKINGVTIRVASYAGNNTRAMKQLTNLAGKMIAFYEPWLGPFPFKEFNIIEINTFGYGQAPPGTMFITKEAFNSLLGEANQFFSQGINHRFAHEIAHQYWGHVIKMPSHYEQWITESFAEYSSSFIVKQLKGESGLKAMTATWKANAGDVKEVSSIAMANRIRVPGDGYGSMVPRTHLIYDKGAYLLSRIHKEIGDDKFLTFMRTFQGQYAWRFATTKDAIAVLRKVTGKDYTEFFEANYWGTGMPL